MLGEAHNTRRAVDFARKMTVNDHVCYVALALHGLSVEQLQLLETEFISTSEQVAILLRFVEKWTPVMSAQVDDFIDNDVIDSLVEKLNRLKQYTNDPSTDGEILY